MSGVDVLGRFGARRRLQWFSMRPFDLSTEEGRGNERHRRFVLTAGTSVMAKVLSVATALISVPLTLNYLGAERFGMWMTVSSLIAMLSFADFGIANGVLSGVAAAHGKDDRDAIRRIVASGFFLLSLIAVCLLGAFLAAYSFVPWTSVFNVKGALAQSEAGPAVAVFITCFVAAIPLALVQRVQMGLQQGFAASLWQCFGTLLGLVGVLSVIANKGGLPWLVLAMAGAPLLAAMLNSVLFYFRYSPDLRPRRRNASFAAARSVAATGGLFFVLQVTVAVAYTSDSLVISQLLGASSVASYAIPEKLFSIVSLVLAMVLAPLWPAYGEAIARGDAAWVRRTFVRATLFAAGTALFVSSVLLAVGPHLIRLWIGNQVAIPFSVLVALAVWRVVEATGNSVAMLLNGARVIRLQVVVALTTAIFAFGLKFAFIPILGVAGSVWATVIAYLLFAAIPYAIAVPRLDVLRPSVARRK